MLTIFFFFFSSSQPLRHAAPISPKICVRSYAPSSTKPHRASFTPTTSFTSTTSSSCSCLSYALCQLKRLELIVSIRGIGCIGCIAEIEDMPHGPEAGPKLFRGQARYKQQSSTHRALLLAHLPTCECDVGRWAAANRAQLG